MTEKKKNKTFILHDESVNTYGFRMLTSGADLTEFKKNPVMLLNHNDWDLPIGRWENIRVENGKILADAVFDLNDERAKKVADKVANDFIRAASIGAWRPKEVNNDASLKLEGQSGATVTKWTVREASICTIGANHNALALYDDKGEKINLQDKAVLLELMDKQPNNQDMDKKDLLMLATIVGLKDDANADAVREAIQGIVKQNDTLTQENKTLQDKVNAFEKAEKDKQTAEAVRLVDTAVKDGRLDAKGKDAMLKLFDNDFEAGKNALEAIPTVESVTKRIENADGKGTGKSVWEQRMEEIETKTKK